MADQIITVIDYGMGNLHSVAKALERVGATVRVTSDAREIEKAEKLVLPGVGAFGDCMKNLNSYGLVPSIHEYIARGRPFLGICLGLQLLFEGSEEDPGVSGLGVFPGMVRKIVAPGLKIPHMGWNNLAFKGKSPLWQDLPTPAYVYFVHSYNAVPDDSGLITAVVDYGEPITAAVGQNNVQAVQFHPEKSSANGLTILKNFKEQP